MENIHEWFVYHSVKVNSFIFTDWFLLVIIKIISNLNTLSKINIYNKP